MKLKSLLEAMFGTDESDRSITMTDLAASLSEADAIELSAILAERQLNQEPTIESESEEIVTDLVPLIEKAVKKDGTAKIKIIQAGHGSSGFYPTEVLKRDGPKVFLPGVHVYLDHPSVSEESDRPERSVKDLAGSLTGPAIWEETGAAGPGLYAPVKFIDSVAPHINDIAAISGMSIRASGTAGTREVDGKKVRSIESIDVAHSIDVVTKPGAGGKVLDLIESARGRQTTPPQEGTDVDKAEFEATKTALTEAEGKIKELETWKTNQEQREADAKLLHEARIIVVDTLKTITLPTLTRDRLTEQLTSNPPIKDGALDKDALKIAVTEAATAELAYLASVNGTGVVRGMGGDPPKEPTVPTLEESDNRIKAALASL